MSKIRVVGGLAVEHGQVLCILHGGRGGWEMPGGKANDGESLDAALRREYREETSREIAEIEEVLSYEPDRVTPDGKPFELTICRVTLTPGRNVPGPEAEAVDWKIPEAIRDGSLPNDYAPALAAVALAELAKTRVLSALSYPARNAVAAEITATVRRALRATPPGWTKR